MNDRALAQVLVAEDELSGDLLEDLSVVIHTVHYLTSIVESTSLEFHMQPLLLGLDATPMLSVKIVQVEETKQTADEVVESKTSQRIGDEESLVQNYRLEESEAFRLIVDDPDDSDDFDWAAYQVVSRMFMRTGKLLTEFLFRISPKDDSEDGFEMTCYDVEVIFHITQD